MTSFIGIDTASSRVHWASTDKIGPDREQYGWRVCNNKNADIRRGELYDYAVDLANHVPPGTHIFCEEPLSLQNGKTTRQLGLAAGAIWTAFYTHADAFWHWVDQSSWKKEVLGRGKRPKDFAYVVKAKAEKEWIQQVVEEMLEASGADPVTLEDYRNQPDLFDAWAICKYGQRMEVLHRMETDGS